LLRDAKRGTRGGKKLAAAVAKTIEAKPVFGQTQSIRGRRWTAQMEIIWYKTGDSGISQTTTAAPCWPQKARSSMAGFSDSVSRGDPVGL
jgi:hypothetical protein